MLKTKLHFEQIPVEDVLKIATRPILRGHSISRHSNLATRVRTNERAEQRTLARALRTSCRRAGSTKTPRTRKGNHPRPGSKETGFPATEFEYRFDDSNCWACLNRLNDDRHRGKMSLLRCRQQIPYHDRSIKRIDLRELRPHRFSQRPGFQLSLPQMFEVK